MGHKMNVVAEPGQIVAVLGGMFPINQTWLADAASIAAQRLNLGNRIETLPTFFFDEEGLLVGKLGFTEETAGGKNVLEYANHLPEYAPDDCTDLAYAAGNIKSMGGGALSIFIDYLSNGPCNERFSVRHYENPDSLHVKSRFDYDRRLVIKGRLMEENLQIAVGVDQESIEEFAAHLQKLKTPEAVYFAGKFAKREKVALGEDVAWSEANEYLNPHPRNASDSDYVERIAGLALHLAKF